MRFWSFFLLGTSLTLGLSAPASAGDSAWSGSGRAGTRHAMMSGRMLTHRWGPLQNGRWYAGWRAPGGWAAYRRPVVGYVLPRYWISPAYHIVDYGAYGLPAPPSGYGWSRYYDDAVMTDRQGRIRDHRSDIAWDHPEQHGPPPGIGYDDEVTAPDAPHYGYEGRWSGTWRDEKGMTRNGEYEGRFEGRVSGGPGVEYDAPPYADTRWSPAPARPGEPVVTTSQAPGYFAGGFYYPGATTTTVVIQPAVTTTTSYVTERVVGRKRGARSCRCK